jgi:hypothetical protein
MVSMIKPDLWLSQDRLVTVEDLIPTTRRRRRYWPSRSPRRALACMTAIARRGPLD